MWLYAGEKLIKHRDFLPICQKVNAYLHDNVQIVNQKVQCFVVSYFIELNILLVQLSSIH